MARNRGEDLQNPDYTGPEGRAWNVNIGDSRMDMPMGATAILGAFLIEAPMAQSRWSSYVATVLHLRDIPEAPPIKNIREGATHEFALGRIKPAFEDNADPANFRTLNVISPPDIEQELILPSDERALEVAGLAVQACVNGELNPGGAYRQEWSDFLMSHE